MSRKYEWSIESYPDTGQVRLIHDTGGSASYHYFTVQRAKELIDRLTGELIEAIEELAQREPENSPA